MNNSTQMAYTRNRKVFKGKYEGDIERKKREEIKKERAPRNKRNPKKGGRKKNLPRRRKQLLNYGKYQQMIVKEAVLTKSKSGQA